MREARFWAKVDRSGGHGACWTWTAVREAKSGYGQFWNPARRTMDLAHRVSYELANGPIPSSGRPGPVGVLVLHRCDNPPCVNPSHLFLGDQRANMRDMGAKGRRDGRGERNGRHRLTAEDVAEIRRSVTGRYGERSALARTYGVSTAQISKILLGQSWAA